MTRRAIDIDDETWRQIKVRAAETDQTVSYTVIAALRHYLRSSAVVHNAKEAADQFKAWVERDEASK